MNHRASKAFWDCFHQLSPELQRLAHANFELLKNHPQHPSLHFKRVGKNNKYWSVRIGLSHRSLGVDVPTGILWFWIGPHDEYNRIIK